MTVDCWKFACSCISVCERQLLHSFYGYLKIWPFSGHPRGQMGVKKGSKVSKIARLLNKIVDCYLFIRRPSPGTWLKYWIFGFWYSVHWCFVYWGYVYGPNGIEKWITIFQQTCVRKLRQHLLLTTLISKTNQSPAKKPVIPTVFLFSIELCLQFLDTQK